METQQPLLLAYNANAECRQTYSAAAISAMVTARDRIAARAAELVSGARNAMSDSRCDAYGAVRAPNVGAMDVDGESIDSGSEDSDVAADSDDEKQASDVGGGGDADNGGDGGESEGDDAVVPAAETSTSPLSLDVVELPPALPNPRGVKKICEARVAPHLSYLTVIVGVQMPPRWAEDRGLSCLQHIITARSFAVQV